MNITLEELHSKLARLSEFISGDIQTDDIHRTIYSTDASAYKEKPMAVIFPKNSMDIKKVVHLANNYTIPIIPRAAGTSLAGQVVGNGIILDLSKYMNKIVELNKKEMWVRVQPGVVLDELNKYLLNEGLYFGPEASTATRCNIAGMVGNNACGLHSLHYGSTRDHTLALTTILSDGSEAVFEALNAKEFEEKCHGDTLENKIYQKISDLLSDDTVRKEINKEFPDPKLSRRNTGYALDLLANSKLFSDSDRAFNFCNLLAGSEGTLAITTEIKLNVVPAPPAAKGLVCVHLESIRDALYANLVALKHKPVAIELMDKAILDLTKQNRKQKQNRFFLKGDPGAILIVAFNEENETIIEQKANDLKIALEKEKLGFHYPLVTGTKIKKVWELRKAGLGVLSNLPGDGKPVSVIEDTAVMPEKLPAYIEEFDQLMVKHNLECVYHAHIATGELHLRPILNLKDPKDVELFHTVAYETAKLVKKYQGSLSGEHGDGRLRGEFIAMMVGEKNYQLFKEIKKTWDPKNIINPWKITDTPKMNTSLRYKPGQKTPEFDTVFDFSKDLGYMRAAEKCNGSGDCRKTAIIGGTMCPSYMATRDEKNTTRARANALREYLSDVKKLNPFDNKEVYEILDLCLSCKACKNECPSNVDIAKLKAEFLQHYYDQNGIPLRARAIAYISDVNALGIIVPSITNFVMSNKYTSKLIKQVLKFAPERSIPLLHKFSLRKWAKKNLPKLNPQQAKKSVYLFIDEFTNYNDVEIGITSIKLLCALNYEVKIVKHDLSARTFLSKGLLRTAKGIANKNINTFKNIISEETPLLGIEPSAILGFRDEYIDLANKENKEAAQKLSEHALLIDEFLAKEFEHGNISQEQFTDTEKTLLYHGHCQQKASASTLDTVKILSIPKNYSVQEIPSGCCGMAGSFGYEEEHYELSQKVGELVLFPTIRAKKETADIVALGTSCRHQIKDGTDVEASHPVEVLYEALIK